MNTGLRRWRPQARHSGFSRRDFLKSAAGVGAAAMLAACGQPTTTPSALTGNKVTLWQFVRSSIPVTLDNYAKRAEDLKASKYPNFSLDIVDIPFGSYAVKYATAFASRSGAPDVFIASMPTYAYGLKVTAPFPEDIGKMLDENIHPRTHKFFKVGAEWHMIPLEFRVGPYLIYNTDHFEEAGLDPAQPPTTVDQLLEYALKLTKRDASGEITRSGFGLRFGGGQAGICDLWLPFLHANKGRIYAEDASTATGYINSPEAVEALQFVTDMIHKHKVTSVTLDPLSEQQFAKGQASMYYRQSYMVGWLARNAPDIKFATAVLPSWKVAPGIADLFNQGWSVYKYSENLDMVWEWLRFNVNQQNDLADAKADGVIPILTPNHADPYVASRPDTQAIQDTLDMPDAPFYDFPGIDEMAARVGQALQEAFQAIKSPQQALDDAATDLDALIAKYS